MKPKSPSFQYKTVHDTKGKEWGIASTDDDKSGHKQQIQTKYIIVEFSQNCLMIEVNYSVMNLTI